jgi:hypothetical protein
MSRESDLRDAQGLPVKLLNPWKTQPPAVGPSRSLFARNSLGAYLAHILAASNR